MYYLASSFILLAFMLIYFRIADKFNIIDKPNERSSHSFVTIRGGGIIFPIAAVIWFLFFGYHNQFLIAALLFIAIVSFFDDIKSLSSKIRMGFHIISVTILFWQLHVFGLPWFGLIIAYIFTLGWINAFNFMDGINGITAISSLVTLFTMLWLNYSLDFISTELLITLIISVIIFSFFNVRKSAKTFAGDVGSVTMAFLFAWFMIVLMLKTGQIEYILFFALYGIDTVITIIYRLIRNENIFEAHRSHLYQYLSNELGWNHVLVSVAYGITQLAINMITILLISNELMNLIVFIGFFMALTTIYLIIRLGIKKRILSQ